MGGESISRAAAVPAVVVHLPTPLAGDSVPGYSWSTFSLPGLHFLCYSCPYGIPFPPNHSTVRRQRKTELVDIFSAVSLRTLVAVMVDGLFICKSLKWGIVCLEDVPSSLSVFCLSMSGFNLFLPIAVNSSLHTSGPFHEYV